MEKFDIDAVARLAKLSIPPEEINALRRDMEEILAFAQTLPEADAPDGSISVGLDALRPDSAADYSAAQLLSAAPESREGHFTVPAVMEE